MKRLNILLGILLILIGGLPVVVDAAGLQTPEPDTPVEEIEWPEPVPVELPITDEMIDRFGVGPFCSIDLSPDKSMLAAAGGVGLYMFDAQTFELLWFVDTEYSAQGITFNADGTKLAVDDTSGTITLFDAFTGEALQQFSINNYTYIDVAFSPDGRMIAAKGYLPETLVWDVETGELLWELPGYTQYSYNLVFSPDSRTLVSSQGYYEYYQPYIVAWDMATGEETLYLERDIFDHIVFDEEGIPQFYADGMYHVAVWSHDGLLRAQPYEYDKDPDNRIWAELYEIIDIQSEERISTFDSPLPRHSGCFSKRFSANNEYLLGSYSTEDSRESHLAVWRVATGDLIHDLPASIYVPRPSLWDDQIVYTVTSIANVCSLVVWDIEQGVPLRMVAGTPPGVGTVRWDQSALIVFAGESMYRWEDGEVSTLTGYTLEPDTRSPDGTLNAVLDHDTGKITIHDSQTDEALFVIDDPVGRVGDFDWSPDGDQLAFVAAGEIVIWDIEQREAVNRLFGHRDTVVSVDWSDYGLASGSMDHTVKVWNPITGDVLQSYDDHNGTVSAVSWSSDGLLASGSEDGAVIIWKTE
ncbi:MAG: hypothetical protein JXJ17_12140 [Anaerolineae bacterium]|nr:hypothetical protein [Anaerolineae bacterium]